MRERRGFGRTAEGERTQDGTVNVILLANFEHPDPDPIIEYERGYCGIK